MDFKNSQLIQKKAKGRTNNGRKNKGNFKNKYHDGRTKTQLYQYCIKSKLTKHSDKRQRLSDQIKKKKTRSTCCLQEIHYCK